MHLNFFIILEHLHNPPKSIKDEDWYLEFRANIWLSNFAPLNMAIEEVNNTPRLKVKKTYVLLLNLKPEKTQINGTY